jgi:hypothetical protein
MRIFFALLLISISLYADSSLWYTEEYPIYVDGNLNYIAYFLEAAAMLVQDTQFRQLSVVAVFFGMLAATLKIIQGGGLTNTAKTTASIVASLTMLFSPSEVHLIDTRVDQGYVLGTAACGGSDPYKKIDNVPWIIAFPASITTTIGDDIERLVGAVTSLNADISTVTANSIGYGNAQKVVENIFKHASMNVANSKDTRFAELAQFNLALTPYISSCVYKVASEDKTLDMFINPYGDYFDAYSPEKLKIDGAYANSFLINVNGTETCESYWNTNIKPKIAVFQDKVLEEAKKYFECLDPSVVAAGLSSAGLIPIGYVEDVGGTTTLEPLLQLKTFIANVASHDIIIDGVKRGGGVELANNLTAAKSLAKLQMEGAGQYKFFAQMLPNSMHFLLGIVMFLGIFVALSAMVRDYDQTLSIIGKYFLGFIALALIKISLQLVNNAVLYFESFKTADKMAFLNNNGASIGMMQNSLSDLATMTSVAGTIGTFLILAIPGIIFKGDFFSLMSGLSGPGQKYIGSDVDTATNSIAEKRSADRAISAIENDASAMKYFKDRGLSIPKGRGGLEYYNSYMSNLQQMGAGIGNAANMGMASDIAKGTAMQTSSSLNQMAGYGSVADMNSVSKVAVVDGQISGSTVNATASAYSAMNNGSGPNIDKIGKGSAAMNAGKLSSMEGIADGISNDKNGLSDYLSGSKMDGRVNANKTISKGEGFSNMNSSEQISLMKKVKENEAVNTFGGIESTNAEIKKHGNVQNAIQDMITSAQEKGITSNEHAKNLRGKYGKNLDDSDNGISLRETASTLDDRKLDEAAGSARAARSSKRAGVDFEQNAFASENLKNQAMTDTLNKQLKEGGAKDGLNSNMKELSDAIKELAKTQGTVAAGKTASEIAKVNTKGEDYFLEQSRKSGVEALGKLGLEYDNTKAALNHTGRIGDRTIADEIIRENTAIEGIKKGAVRAGSGVTDYLNKAIDGIETFSGLDINFDGKVGGNNVAETSTSDIVSTAAVTVAVGSEIVKGPGNGIIGKSVKGVHGKFKKLTGKSVPDSSDSTTDGTNNSSSTDNNTQNNKKAEVTESFHDESPRKTNFAGQPTSAHPINNTSIPQNDMGVNTNNGFFEKRWDSFTDALNGNGSARTRLSLAATGLILGSQSETFANTLNAIDPTQMIMGQDLGAGSDIPHYVPNSNAPGAPSQGWTNPNQSATMTAIQSDPMVNSGIAGHIQEEHQKNMDIKTTYAQSEIENLSTSSKKIANTVRELTKDKQLKRDEMTNAFR